MDLNYRAIIKIFGMLFMIMGLTLMLPLLVGLIYGETDSSLAFLKTAAPCLAAGLLIYLLIGRKHYKKLQRRDGVLVVSSFWLVVSVIGALPFMIQGCIPDFPDAFFETCSGFSTTGSSILTNVEALPKAMLFWRSFTHWIGGMGILVFAVALLPSLGISGQTIVRSEAPGPTLSKIVPRMSDMAKVLYTIYLCMTLLEAGLLMFGGMDLFDSVVYSFATVGTGGFATKNASVAAYHSAYIEGVITVFMIAAGVNFNLYFYALTGSLKAFIKDTEFKVYILVIGVVTALITLDLCLTNTFSGVLSSFRYAVFQVASIITTTGFATADYDKWPTFCCMMLFVLFFIGACSSSTAGGIKVIRVTLLLKMIKRYILMKMHPNATIQIKANERPILSDTMQNICSFTFLYIASVFIVGLVISLDGFDIVTNFSAAATCIGNIGPGFNAVGPAMNFSIFSWPSKIILAISMIAGRLEMYTFLMILTPKFWNSAR
ncbi:MAG: TrkH family potassium uptake protein [Anaerovoracaceae bacterium]|jgi:trk system potassium uptake protein TrkH